MAPAAPDKARLLRFPEWNGKKGLSATYSLTDADFSEGSKIMTMRHKGRGVGDCGSAGEWKWIGSDFKLTGYWHQEKCDGREFDTEGRKYKVFPRRR